MTRLPMGYHLKHQKNGQVVDGENAAKVQIERVCVCVCAGSIMVGQLVNGGVPASLKTISFLPLQSSTSWCHRGKAAQQQNRRRSTNARGHRKNSDLRGLHLDIR